ncbi:MAG TPA: POTRA domain-containing protein, partial [Blastocatellia bacterium]|nr:POTRA domain-containing protein [Blastocatellia bacterium]
MPRSITLFVLTVITVLFSYSLPQSVQAQDNPAGQDVLIEDIEIRGSRRIPKESILYYVQSKIGERYDEAQARRDLESILNLGFFDPLKARISNV